MHQLILSIKSLAPDGVKEADVSQKHLRITTVLLARIRKGSNLREYYSETLRPVTSG